MVDAPVLQAEGGALAGREWTITESGLRLGRELGNEVHIDDPAVSRQHARVLLHNGAVWVQDAGSRNGVFVNGERVPDHRQAKPGDKVTVGAHVFRVGMAGSRPIASNPNRSSPVERPPAAKGSLLPYVLVGMALVLLFALLATALVAGVWAFGVYGTPS